MIVVLQCVNEDMFCGQSEIYFSASQRKSDRPSPESATGCQTVSDWVAMYASSVASICITFDQPHLIDLLQPQPE